VNKAVIGVLGNQAQAEALVLSLRTAEFATSDISILFASAEDTPEIDAKPSRRKVRAGNILVTVHSENGEMRHRAEQIVKQHGGKIFVREGSRSRRAP
jgi:hypothetical protein